ncbi:MAG: eukaryotic-like serine/threonine-protein kinase [Gaiellaceae bacterium]|nr:eukaryotic-like serine/threonine-protein kinase [Gaiellaceae bacterium]
MSAATVGGRYRLEQPLGQGGMATVYLAHDTELGRPVAVKLLAENLAGDAAFRTRFLREAQLSARLSHPNVVGVYDTGEAHDGRPYIVMEYVEGTTLAELGRLPADEAVALAVQACHALAHAHAAGLIHRDVKPQNLLLRTDGTLKVADFGIARAAEATALTQAGTVLGTAAYLSPEQAAGEQLTAATDVYSLGAVLYELLTGRAPHELESLADLADRDEIAPIGELVPEVPPRIEDAVMRSLARNPAYRPASAEAFAAELTGKATAPTRVAPVPRPHVSKAWALAAAAVVAAGAIGGVVFAIAKSSTTAPPAPRQTRVRPIPPGADAQEQARNVAAWLRARAARP